MKDNEIEVSVVCLSYNHEKYIKKAIDSFLIQKTNFKYEIIIHDDNSIDKTASIIQEYEKKYPDKIRAIYQKKNRYSEGHAIIEEYILPLVRGKYVAFCECDDYWCDCNKLQLQYDFMERHKECSLCAHNTIFHNLNGIKEDFLFNNWKKIHCLQNREIFMEWKIHTSSFFVRKENAYRPDYALKYWFGDYVRVTNAANEGKIMVLPYVMSVYNYGVKTGVLHNVDYDTIKQQQEKIENRKEYLEQFNKASNGRFNSIICERIAQIELESESLKERHIIQESENKNEIINAAKKILSMKTYKQYMNSLSGKQKIKEYIRYNGYLVYPIWIKIWKK